MKNNINNSFISESKNDMFSHLKGIDLQELIIQVENYYLTYRDSLNLPENLSFGIEIEYENIIRMFVDKYIRQNHNDWISKKDGSLKMGGEITSPILSDNKKNWNDIKDICLYLKLKHANTSCNAGGHIHIGADILGNNMNGWKNFVKIYTIYENVIFRFLNGDKINTRKGISEYAIPIADKLYLALKHFDYTNKINHLKEILPSHDRYQAINFTNVDFYNFEKYTKNTIEFRSPNATTEEVVWQNNINTISKLLLTSNDNSIDTEYLDYKLEKDFISPNNNYFLYNEINLKNALEFVDIVFDNNLDKVYFLRQYLKEFQKTYCRESAVISKKFVR